MTAEVFAGAPSDRAPEQTVYLARFVFQPGGGDLSPQPSRAPPSSVSLRVLWVDAGGGDSPRRAGAAAGATGPAEDLTEPGTEVILEPGDAIFYEDDVVHTARGASDEEAVVFGTLVLTSGEPLLMPVGMDMSATPAA